MQFNLAVARSRAPQSKIWAVVKANAYGHGLLNAMRGFADADGLALIEFESAAFLREQGWKKPILLLEGCFEAQDLAIAQKHRLDIVVHCREQLEMLERCPLEHPLDVHLKMNSGMNRLGFPPQEFRSVYERLRQVKAVRRIVLMTHFANAEAEENADMLLSFREQVRIFNNATEGLAEEYSLSNSAAHLFHPDVNAGWIRPGIMLYGASPGRAPAQALGLKPVMTLSSKVIGIQEIKRGDAVGYGSLFVADKPMRIGVVACGYADGYPRHAPTGAPVLIDGVRSRLIGRVSMDLITVDLTPVPHAQIGSDVVLWGESLPIDELAQAAGTIGYELMCALTARVKMLAVPG